MQSSLCKRVASEFKLQRYIPEYQVYQLCITWQSEIPIPPTIFYLSEIFIYPYTKPHEFGTDRCDSIKREIVSPNVLGDSATFIERANQSIPIGGNLLRSLSVGTGSQPEGRQGNPRILDYEKTANGRGFAPLIRLRKKEMVRHLPFKAADEPRKRRKA